MVSQFDRAIVKLASSEVVDLRIFFTIAHRYLTQQIGDNIELFNSIGLVFMGPVAAETCGACMANVHIRRDLRDALRKVRDVDPQDYGNILVLVNEGNLLAEIHLRADVESQRQAVAKHSIPGVLRQVRSEPFACVAHGLGHVPVSEATGQLPRQ